MLAEITQVKTDWQLEFTDWMQRKGWSRLTIRSYEQNLRIFMRWYAKENRQEFRPEFLTSWDMAAFRRFSLEVERARPATWNNRLSALSALQAWCNQEGLINCRPLEGIGSARSEAMAPRWLDQSDFGQLMRRIERDRNSANTQQRRDRAVRDGALIALMVFAGLRVSEVIALRTQDVTIGERSGKVRVHLGKGEKYREVPLAKEARQALGDWLALTELKPESLVFHGITQRAVQKRIAALRREAGLTELTPHRLRHTCAKRMLDAGRPITEVQKILGHANLNTTARYLTPGWEDLQAAVDSVALGKRS